MARMGYGRKRKTNLKWLTPAVTIVAALAAGWWYFSGRPATPRTSEAATSATPPPAIAAETSTPRPAPTESGRRTAPPPTPTRQVTSRDEPLTPRTNAQTTPTPAIAAAPPEPNPPGATTGAAPRPNTNPIPSLLRNGLVSAQPQNATTARQPETQSPASKTALTPAPGAPKTDSSRKVAAGKLVEARHDLNAALARGLPESEAARVRLELAQLADQTIFCKERQADDPLVTTYKIQNGDYLSKVARKYDVPHEFLMDINGIQSDRRIRAGQSIKVVQGPFHARISKSQFRLDVYLQDLYVRSYPVGLGRADGTPLGTWRVEERLPNPTYFPPESATDRRVIGPDDPSNPLGDYWIGLKGVDGDARGQEGFGIHGTIDPASIGRAASLGCVRMRNEDVAYVFNLLQPGKSTVTIVP